jgi:hypothetical protein
MSKLCNICRTLTVYNTGTASALFSSAQSSCCHCHTLSTAHSRSSANVQTDCSISSKVTTSQVNMHGCKMLNVIQQRQCTYNVNNEARSRSYWCCVTYSKCVFVALVIRDAKCMRRIILSSVAWPAPQYFSTLSHKRHDFLKKHY